MSPSQLNPPQPLSSEIFARLRTVPLLHSLSETQLHCLDGARELHLAPGELLVRQDENPRRFWILLEGSIRIWHQLPEGHQQTMHVMEAPDSLGETFFLANMASLTNLAAASPVTLVEFDETQFWNLMAMCPEVRQTILDNVSKRLAKMQSATFQQEKMASLGALAAGLMHELNNPGAAARRAATQLRENLLRMHEFSARLTRAELSAGQKDCLFDLQKQALQPPAPDAGEPDPLAHADAEQALVDWMETAGIADAWKLAPTLISIGIDAGCLECARQSFGAPVFADTVAWLEALISSQQLVATIEESIGRVSDLVKAVKTYAYEGKGQAQQIDVKQSIYATLIILGHKLREKQIVLEKKLAPDLPPLTLGCHGINQVWTNLLDNAIDASPQNGRIAISTWAEANPPTLCVRIADQGPGIPLECQAQIFDPFFTTKPAGVGTGLGLGIVYRIVEQCGGQIHFSSVPGLTEFVVRLPTPKA